MTQHPKARQYQKRNCPRCNGTGEILWPDPEANIDRDVALDMLHGVVHQMYSDLRAEGKLDGSIPEQEYTPFNLWALRTAQVKSGADDVKEAKLPIESTRLKP